MVLVHTNKLLEFCEMLTLIIDDYIKSMETLQLILIAIIAIARKIIYETLDILTMKANPKKRQNKNKEFLIVTYK
jgi:hypothetical protein